jgi:hypothetical protein
MYETIEQSLNTPKAIIIDIKDIEIKGNKRKRILARKAKGKKIFYLIQYENGLFSSAC